MKKILASVMALLLLFVAGCGQENSASVSGEEADPWGITLSAEDVTNTGMTLVCTQSGGKFKGELQTGTPFVLERFVEGEWFPVTTRTDEEVAWTMIALGIQPNAVTKWKVDWEFLYGHLEPGTYRLSKEITDFRGPGKGTEKVYYVEFSIDEL